MNLRRSERKWSGPAMRDLAFATCAALLLIDAFAAGIDAPDAGRAIELRIVARRVEGGLETIRLVRGEKATLRLTSDEPMTVHVHGYDIETPLIPGMTATMAIAARFAGRFPVTAHIHDSSTSTAPARKHSREPTLFYLEVLPE
jgi:siroheme synthase